MTRFPIALAMLAALALPLKAQQRSPAADDDSIPIMRHRDLDGPRIGMTYVSGPAAEAKLAEHGLTPLMSLIGWHFEQVLRPQGGGPSFVTQEVFMAAGLEQGTFVPSATVLLGIRFPSGFEFGMGPNVSPIGAALAVGIGKTLNYGGVAIPINLAVVRSQGALRTSLVAGYAIRRR